MARLTSVSPRGCLGCGAASFFICRFVQIRLPVRCAGLTCSEARHSPAEPDRGCPEIITANRAQGQRSTTIGRGFRSPPFVARRMNPRAFTATMCLCSWLRVPRVPKRPRWMTRAIFPVPRYSIPAAGTKTVRRRRTLQPFEKARTLTGDRVFNSIMPRQDGTRSLFSNSSPKRAFSSPSAPSGTLIHDTAGASCSSSMAALRESLMRP